MRLDEYAAVDACGLADLIRKREVHEREVEKLAREAIAAINPVINAVIETFSQEPDRQSNSGPFGGVPFLRKDLLMQQENELIEYGSRLAAGVRAKMTSELALRQLAAGLVTLGRTATPEFGFSVVTEPVTSGPVRNPWNPERSAGGSSGGAAAAVAAGIVPMAHANDAGGSIRIPAACCGLVGLKPTRGRISVGRGLGSVLFGLGVEHAVTRTVRDCAALLDATSGPVPGDPFIIPLPSRRFADEVGAPTERLRIAVTTKSWGNGKVDREVSEAAVAAAQLCASLGHTIEEADLTIDYEPFQLANLRLWASSTVFAIERIAKVTGRSVGPDVLEAATMACYEYGRKLSAADLFGAEVAINTVSRQVSDFFGKYDVLLTPTIAKQVATVGTINGMAPDWTAESWNDMLFNYAPFTALFNATGQPAISLPLATDSSGLPIGVQFVAGFAKEDVLFRLAASLEQAAPWASRRPRISAGAISS